MAMHEVDDVVDLGPTLEAGDGAGLDDEGINAVEPTGHAFKHHQLGALDVDLAQQRAGDLVDQRIEAAHRHAVASQDVTLAQILEQGRGLDVRPDLDLDFAVAIAERGLVDFAAQLALEQPHVVQRFRRRIDQVIMGFGEGAVELVGAVGDADIE
jgi:hypothetical protein